MSKPDKHQAIDEQLRNLSGDFPTPRILSLEDKLLLIKAIGGPRTTRQIIKAAQTLPIKRIPFLFNSLDTQLVIDVLGNEMDEALAKTESKKV